MNSKNGIEENKDKEAIQNNMEENKFKIFFSDYGYIKIKEKDIDNKLLSIYNFIQYGNNNNLLFGSIYKNSIKDNINIRLKCFTGSRKVILIEKISIYSKINILIEHIPIDINKSQKYTKNSQQRLYSCKSGLRELNPNFTFIENNLKDNELILFFPELPLFFSHTMKGKSIELSLSYRQALKITTDVPQYVLGNIGYSTGRHYFEIKLLTDPMIRSVVVGYSVKKDENNLYSTEMKTFYGFILSDMKKMKVSFPGGEEKSDDYGEVCNINDKIGVLFDSKNDGIYISFYRNKKNLGIAFEKLPTNLKYFPTFEMGLCGSKIQLNNNLDFPDS